MIRVADEMTGDEQIGLQNPGRYKMQLWAAMHLLNNIIIIRIFAICRFKPEILPRFHADLPLAHPSIVFNVPTRCTRNNVNFPYIIWKIIYEGATWQYNILYI